MNGKSYPVMLCTDSLFSTVCFFVLSTLISTARSLAFHVKARLAVLGTQFFAVVVPDFIGNISVIKQFSHRWHIGMCTSNAWCQCSPELCRRRDEGSNFLFNKFDIDFSANWCDGMSNMNRGDERRKLLHADIVFISSKRVSWVKKWAKKFSNSIKAGMCMIRLRVRVCVRVGKPADSHHSHL